MHFQDFDLPTLPRGHQQTGWLEVATRADGRGWQVPVLYVTGRPPAPTLIFAAAAHCDEA